MCGVLARAAEKASCARSPPYAAKKPEPENRSRGGFHVLGNLLEYSRINETAVMTLL